MKKTLALGLSVVLLALLGVLFYLLAPASPGRQGRDGDPAAVASPVPEPVFVQARSRFGTFEYVNPLPGASLVSVRTSLILRAPGRLQTAGLQAIDFAVKGGKSGVHEGQVSIGDDRRTVIFTPTQPFALDEEVSVEVRGILDENGEPHRIPPFSLRTHPEKPSLPANPVNPSAEEAGVPEFAQQGYRTLPVEFPRITVHLPASGEVAEGYLFLSNFTFRATPAAPSFLMILDNRGEPVFHRRLQEAGGDFKKQPGGLLTYWSAPDGGYVVLDSSYRQVDLWRAGNGYQADGHGFQLLPNGHGLLMIYDLQYLDLRGVSSSASSRAIVAGLVIQELDSQKRVVFEWRSWDHIPVADTSVDLNAEEVDYVHGNAIERDRDGNYLISSRHLNEITKISSLDGQVLWRFGGKKNQFDWLNDIPFVQQHDIRRLSNGNLTLFDNHGESSGGFSRAVEYRLNETQKTAELIWSHRNSPDVQAAVAGNMQRLPNGNTLIGWGSGWPSVTEVTADGRKVFELGFSRPQASYRAFRFPWKGQPTEPPTLIAERREGRLDFFVSWNGDTEGAAYRIEGVDPEGEFHVVGNQPRSGFETRISFALDQREGKAFTAYRAVALDSRGAVLGISETVDP